MDDAEGFSETMRCMESIGLGPEAQEGVFRVRKVVSIVVVAVVARDVNGDAVDVDVVLSSAFAKPNQTSSTGAKVTSDQAKQDTAKRKETKRQTKRSELQRNRTKRS